MIKVLFVIGQLGVGGAERQLIYLATHLNRERYKVLVCSLSEDISLLPLLSGAQIETVILTRVMEPDLTRPFRLMRLVKSFHPDLIHSYLFVANTWSRIVGALLKTPVILSERSSGIGKNRMTKFIDRLLSPFGSYLIANSKSGANSIIQNKGFNPQKVKFIYNGIPIEHFQNKINDDQKKALLLDLNIAENMKIIGSIANFSEAKNHMLLFDSYKILMQSIPNTCVLCIGSGPQKEKMKSYVNTIGIENNVIFAGRRDDIPQCLALMDVLVLSSRWEGLPNVILEAMAAQCPVVATNVGGVNELISDGVTGWLVKPEDEVDLAKKIKLALKNDEVTKKVIKQASSFVNDNFSIDKMVKETECIYEKVLSKK